MMAHYPMRFVVQHPALQPQHLQQLSTLAHGHAFTRVNADAYYLKFDNAPDTALTLRLRTYCMENGLDCALVPDAQTLEHFGLAVMDMDSTLISIECIDEIADMCGLKKEISLVTESAMRGEIEFSESLRQRVSLLKGLEESALQRVIDERLQLNPGALKWIQTCKDHGITTLLVSGGFDFFAEKVRAMTGLDQIRANKLEIIDHQLTGKVLGDIVDGQAKADHLIALRDKLGLQASQVIAIGDGANDLKMMSVAAVGVAYHAKPIVQQQATYALNHMGLDGIANLFTVI